MALTTCPKCNNKLSDQAEKCIYCGYPLHRPITQILNKAENKTETPQNTICSDQNNPHAERRLLLLCASILLIALIFSFFLATTHKTSQKSSSASIKTNTCQVCGRSFQAGDSGGNFKSISYRNMCVNCYNNFQWGQSALGK